MSELANCRFWVTLDPADAYLPAPQAQQVAALAEAGFQEVSGLGAELEVMPYAEGGSNGFVHQLPVRHSWGRITLKRGIVKGQGLWQWYRAGLTQSLGARRDGVSDRAREKARQYDWDYVVGDLERVYSELVAKGGRAP